MVDLPTEEHAAAFRKPMPLRSMPHRLDAAGKLWCNEDYWRTSAASSANLSALAVKTWLKMPTETTLVSPP